MRRLIESGPSVNIDTFELAKVVEINKKEKTLQLALF